MTQANFAGYLGFSEFQVANVERGGTEPSVMLLLAVAKKCDVNPRWLFWGEEPQYKPSASRASEAEQDYLAEPSPARRILVVLPDRIIHADIVSERMMPGDGQPCADQKEPET